MVTVYWQCSKNTSPGPHFCLRTFETEEDEVLFERKSATATCPVCDNALTHDDVVAVDRKKEEAE